MFIGGYALTPRWDRPSRDFHAGYVVADQMLLQSGMKKPAQSAAMIMAMIASSGCAVHRPGEQAWKLVKGDAGEILIPPHASNRDNSRSTFRADVPATASCEGTKGVIEINRRGKRLAVTVFPAALAAEPQGWLSEWSTGLEARGCIPEGAAAVLAAQIATSVPLGLNVATQLLHPNDRQTGQVDIQPGMRLQVISPILKEGTPAEAPIVSSAAAGKLTVTLESSNLIGYEVAWYGVTGVPGANAATIVPDYAERHIEGKTEVTRPVANSLHFPESAGYYRLFYKSGSTDYTAILLGARTWPELERSTKALDEASCGNIAAGSCVLVPKRFAINPMVSVTVNGKPETLNWGSSVGGAIQHAGVKRPADVLAQLKMKRPYKGKDTPVVFDARDPSILNLMLTGGEVISWNPPAHDSAPLNSTPSDSAPRR